MGVVVQPVEICTAELTLRGAPCCGTGADGQSELMIEVEVMLVEGYGADGMRKTGRALVRQPKGDAPNADDGLPGRHSEASGPRRTSFMRAGRLELPRVAPPDPKSGASTDSATPAAD